MIFHVALHPTHNVLKRLLCSLAFLLLTNASISLAQEPPQPPPDQSELNELIRRAAIRVTEYKTRFKDLTAEEEQTIEEFDAQGNLEKQRRVASDLFIYQSQVDPTEMFEYRDVKSVDGKTVKKREVRLVNILTKSAKADSVKKEFDRIFRESQRYELGNSFYGLTLNQGIALEEKGREAFRFNLAGREQVNGHDSIVVEYQQVSQTPAHHFDLKNLPGPLKGALAFYRGRLWLDAETTQIRREVRELTLRLPSLDHPLMFYRFELDYADSRFGFLTPRRLVITYYSRGRLGADKKPVTLVGAKITFEYGAFIRFAVDLPDASIDPPKKP
ncbi:MAG TPA: hypothetical protein VFZ40_17670 [Pyrinomonadaceae bacterium]